MELRSRDNKWSLKKSVIVLALTILALLATIIIRVPIPPTGGYFNLGDVFVILAGLWLGPAAGLIVGSIGPTIADAIYDPKYILATIIIKGAEGYFVGYFAGDRRKLTINRSAFAALIGGLIIVIGYFLFEALIYPFMATFIPFFKGITFKNAVSELLPNIMQAIVGIVLGLIFWFRLRDD